MKKKLNKFLSNSILSKIKLDDYKNYIQFMEENIKTHKKSLADSYEFAIKDIDDPEEQQELYEQVFMDDYEGLDRTYSQILRRSLFLTLYSFIENDLKEIAHKLEKKERTSIKLSDISHRGIRQYLFFIETVSGIQILISEELRQKFLGYNTLRNHIVHNDGSLMNQKQQKSLRPLKEVTFREAYFSNDKYLGEMSADFNITYLKDIEEFFEALFTALKTNFSTP